MNALELRRRTLGKDVYKKTVEGNPAIAQGSLARRYPGITMQGWTEQDGTPTPEAPVPIVSAGTQNQDAGKYQYQVKLTGANLFNPANLTGGEIVEYNGVQCYKYTDNAINFTYVDDFAENTQYCFSVMMLSSEGNEEKNTDIFIVYTDGPRSMIRISHNQLINVVSSANKTVAMITGNSNWSVARYIDLTMTTLGIGTEPIPYQPYKEQTVTLTADRPLTKWDRLEKRNGQWGWVYKSAEIVLDGSEVWVVYGSGFHTSYALLETYTRTHGVCEQGNIKADDSTDGLYGPNSIWLGVKNSDIYWNENPYFNAELEDSGIGNWKNHLSQNPAVIWYETTEETFIPLSESEQEQMNELYTFRPTTVLSNDCECEMTLTYKTKKSLEVTT